MGGRDHMPEVFNCQAQGDSSLRSERHNAQSHAEGGLCNKPVQDDMLLIHAQEDGDTVKKAPHLFLTRLKITLRHSDFVLLIR
jgi:hypothetical protein